MKSMQLTKRLLVLLVLVCCFQQIWAGMLVKGSRAKNNTATNNPTTKPPKVVYRIKTTTTTTTTTAAKPELETTTLPADFDLDGRSAFINNKYVLEAEESTSDTSPSVQTVQMNTDESFQGYVNNSPQIKESIYNGHAETQKLSKKPILNYDISQFDDYEEEETSESDDIPENCEDTQESLGDNDEDNSHDAIAEYTIKQEENLDKSESNMFEETYQTKPYDTSNYGSQKYIIRGASYDNNNQNKPSESNNYNQQTNSNQGLTHDHPPQHGYDTTKPTQQPNYNNQHSGLIQGIKSKPANQYQTQSYYGQIIRKEQPQQVLTNQYVQTNPLEHYGHTPQNSYEKSKTQQHLKPHYNIEKSPQPLFNYQKPTQNIKLNTKQQQVKLDYNSKPENSFYNKRLQNGTLFNYYNNHTDLLSTSGNFNSPNYSNGNSKVETSPFSSTSAQNKKFKTVSSSVQYVSTPLADLVFKYSIGVAKHTKVTHNSTDIKAHTIYNVPNDINGKTE